MNKNKGCKPENFKLSDQKKLHADAKIIIALLNRQPRKLEDLCKEARINKSTFSRMRRLLKKEGILMENQEGYTLWFYNNMENKIDNALRTFLEKRKLTFPHIFLRQMSIT